MAYVKATYRTIKGKRYGPYLEQRESYREGDTVKTKHIAYVGAGISMAGAPGVGKSDKPGFYQFVTDRLSEKSEEKNHYGENINIVDFGSTDPSPYEVETLNAVTLWTSANVKSVRDVSAFKKGENRVGIAAGVKTEGAFLNHLQKDFISPKTGEKFKPNVPWMTKTNKTDYAKSHEVMTNLAKAKRRPTTTYRGIQLNADEIKSMKVGDKVDFGKVSSVSTSWESAYKFSNELSGKVGGKPVLFVIKNTKRGTDISKLSKYNQEKELVTSGKVKINHKTMVTDYYGKPYMRVTVEQI